MVDLFMLSSVYLLLEEQLVQVVQAVHLLVALILISVLPLEALEELLEELVALMDHLESVEERHRVQVEDSCSTEHSSLQADPT